MNYIVELRQLPAQPMSVVRGRITAANLSTGIRALFDQFYSRFKSRGEFNIIFYPGDVSGEFEIACGVLLSQDADAANALTPAGTTATTTHVGPYHQLKHAHAALRDWVRENGRKIAGPSWEIYGHWSDDPAQLRTHVFYLLIP